MNNQLPNRKNVFEGLQLMFYSSSNALAGSNAWIGTGGYTGSYRLQEDTLREKLVDSIVSFKKALVKIIKPTFLFSFYQIFTAPIPKL